MMIARKMIPLCLVALVGNFTTQSAAADWEHDIATATSKAKQQNVPMVIHFYADWCGPCQTMERDVLHSSDVRSQLGNNLVGVKVNSDFNKDLVRQYGVTSLPTDVFVSADGRVMKVSQGSRSRTDYNRLLSQYAAVGQPATAQQQTAAQGTAAQGTAAQQQPATSKSVTSSLVSETRSSIQQDVEVAGSSTSENEQPKQAAATVSIKDGIRLGLDGYCPVTLMKQTEWLRGSKDFQMECDGVVYQFSGAAELKLFQADPQRYKPQLHGCDPVTLATSSEIEPGRLNFGATYRKRLYFFASADTRATFLKSPSEFASDIHFTFFAAQQPDAQPSPKT